MENTLTDFRQYNKKYRYIKATEYINQHNRSPNSIVAISGVLELADSPFYKFGPSPSIKTMSQFEVDTILSRIGLLCPVVGSADENTFVGRANRCKEFNRCIILGADAPRWGSAELGKLSAAEFAGLYEKTARYLEPGVTISGKLIGYVLVPSRTKYDWLPSDLVSGEDWKRLVADVVTITNLNFVGTYDDNSSVPGVANQSAHATRLNLIADAASSTIHQLFVRLQADSRFCEDKTSFGHVFDGRTLISDLRNIFVSTLRVLAHAQANQFSRRSELAFKSILPFQVGAPAPTESGLTLPKILATSAYRSKLIMENMVADLAFDRICETSDQIRQKLEKMAENGMFEHLYHHSLFDKPGAIQRHIAILRNLAPNEKSAEKIIADYIQKVRDFRDINVAEAVRTERQRTCGHNAALSKFMKKRTKRNFEKIAEFYDEAAPDEMDYLKCKVCDDRLMCPHIDASMRDESLDLETRNSLARFAIPSSSASFTYCRICSEFLYEISGSGSKVFVSARNRNEQLAINLEVFTKRIIATNRIKISVHREIAAADESESEAADLEKFVKEVIVLVLPTIDNQFFAINREPGEASVKVLKRRYFAAVVIFSMLFYLGRRVPKRVKIIDSDVFWDTVRTEIEQIAKSINIGLAAVKTIVESYFGTRFEKNSPVELSAFLEIITGKYTSVSQTIEQIIPRYSLYRVLNENGYLVAISRYIRPNCADCWIANEKWDTDVDYPLGIPKTDVIEDALFSLRRRASTNFVDLLDHLKIPAENLIDFAGPDDPAMTEHHRLNTEHAMLLIHNFVPSHATDRVNEIVGLTNKIYRLVYGGIGKAEPLAVDRSTLSEPPKRPFVVQRPPPDEIAIDAAASRTVCDNLNINNLVFQPLFDAIPTVATGFLIDFYAATSKLCGDLAWKSFIPSRLGWITEKLAGDEFVFRDLVRKSFDQKNAAKLIRETTAHISRLPDPTNKKLVAMNALFQLWTGMIEKTKNENIAKYILDFVRVYVNICNSAKFVEQPNVYRVRTSTVFVADDDVAIENDDVDETEATARAKDAEADDNEEEGDELEDGVHIPGTIINNPQDEEEDYVENSNSYD